MNASEWSPRLLCVVMLFGLSSAEAREAECRWLGKLPDTDFSMSSLVACPAHSEVAVYWDSTRTRRIARLGAESGEARWVLRQSSTAVPYACATDFQHHMDMEPLPTNTVPQVIIEAARWEVDVEVTEYNKVLADVGTPECDITDPEMGYWCYLLADITPEYQQVSGEDLPCLDSKLENLTRGMVRDNDDSIVTNCTPERPARGEDSARLAERKQTLSLLEWAVLYREGFDPAREVLIQAPVQLSRKKQNVGVSSSYRICTISD